MNKTQTTKEATFLTEANLTTGIQPEEQNEKTQKLKLRITATKEKQEHNTPSQKKELVPLPIEPSKSKKLPIFQDIELRYNIDSMRIKSYVPASETSSAQEDNSAKTVASGIAFDPNSDIPVKESKRNSVAQSGQSTKRNEGSNVVDDLWEAEQANSEP